MSRITELEKNLAAAATSVDKIDALNTLAEELDDIQLERSLELFIQAADLAQVSGYREGLAWALAGQAKIAGNLNRFEEMSRLSFQSIEELRGLPPNQALAFAQHQLSWMYFYLGEYSTALEWGIRGLEASRACASQIRIASSLDVIASIYSVMEEHSQALTYHAEALTAIRETGDQNECSVILNNVAMTLMAAGKFPEALEKAQEGLELARAQEMTPFISNNIDTVAQILFKMGDLERAEQLLLEAIDIAPVKRPDYLFAELNKSLGQISFATGKYNQAIHLFNEAIADLEQLGARGEQAVCYRLLSQVHEQQGNYALALEQYKTYDMHREATSGKDAARRFAALIASYDIQLAQRDAEIERLRNVELQNEIEERKRIQSVLEKIATIDALTNLYNRGHFFTLAEHEVERALRYQHPLTALMLDIDHFKAVNDRHGHIAGDQILVVVAGIIRQNLRDVDLAGRYGGEEFTILLPETSADNALLVAERMRAAIVHQGILTDAGRVPVTVSVGVAGFSPNDLGAPRELIVLLDRADRGLYQAKRAGRNCSRLVN